MKKGFTLVEVMVAIFIFVLVIIAAYQVYERSQKTYLLGEQLSDLQENLRFAFEQLSYDLRVAGFNVYPDAESTRPDEQIEGMWRNAIAIRSDFDQKPADDEQRGIIYRCTDVINNSSKEATPDGRCDGDGFMNVSTSNDEIRIYALAKKPNTGGTKISFFADLSIPRDGTADTKVEIPGVVLMDPSDPNYDPPYTLYRITLPYEKGYNGGTVPVSDLIWTPIASNIYSLNFTYYRSNGVSADNLLQYDPEEVPEDNVYRQKHGFPFPQSPTNHVANVYFEIKGMTRNPDPTWRDREDTIASSKPHRKLEFSSTVYLNNVGFAPRELADTVPPDSPKNLSVILGYCNGVLLTWEPSMSPDVSLYAIQNVSDSIYDAWGGDMGKYKCDDVPDTCIFTSKYEIYSQDLVGYYIPFLQNGATYHVWVYAQDSSGNISPNPTNLVDYVVTPNPIKPNPPIISGAAQNIHNSLNRLFVNFEKPVGYDPGQSSTCGEPPHTDDPYFNNLVRDLYGYRLYHKRQLSSSGQDFTPDDNYRVATELEPSDNPLTALITKYPDIKACPCEYYTYKIQSATYCATEPSVGKSGCTFLSNFSELPKDENDNPIAFEVPELQPFDSNPVIVPAKPKDLFSTANEVSPNEYSITLTFPITKKVESFNKDDNTYTDVPDQEIECWRYKVYLYQTEEDANNNNNGQEIFDTNIIGAGDGPDWDAMVDGGKQYLKEDELLSFDIGNITIPPNQKRYLRIRGYYKCASGDYLGELSKVTEVPCVIDWTPQIKNPPFDDITITTFTYDINLEISGIATNKGVSISSVEFKVEPNCGSFTPQTIGPNPPACEGVSSCEVLTTWNNTGCNDGQHIISAKITDSKGCATTITRRVNISRNCGNFDIINENVLNDMLNFDLYKINSGDYLLLAGISFSSDKNYLYDDISFYGLNAPTYWVTTPPTPSPQTYILWQSSTPVSMDGNWMGFFYTYPFMENNWCGYLRLYPDPTNSFPTNRFTINFDKNINSGNGTLNLLGNFHFKLCNLSEEKTFTLTNNNPYSVDFNKTICTYEVILDDPKKGVTVTEVNYCNGKVFVKRNKNQTTTGKIKAYVPNDETICTNIPIYFGP